MKKTINGVRYNTENCEVLGEKTVNYNGYNYDGDWLLLLAPNKVLLLYYDKRGTDCNTSSMLVLFEAQNEHGPSLTIDDFELDENQEKRCQELGLITTCD